MPDFFAGIDKFKVLPPVTLSTLLGKDFKRDFSYTLRCGGRYVALSSRHNWEKYELVDGTEYRLTLEDAKKLQGFDDYNMVGSDKAKWKMLGNTIPTVLTRAIAKRLDDFQV
jgi:DNA (cytosine-5)-methyltransferase 1